MTNPHTTTDVLTPSLPPLTSEDVRQLRSQLRRHMPSGPIGAEEYSLRSNLAKGLEGLRRVAEDQGPDRLTEVITQPGELVELGFAPSQAQALADIAIEQAKSSSGGFRADPFIAKVVEDVQTLRNSPQERLRRKRALHLPDILARLEKKVSERSSTDPEMQALTQNQKDSLSHAFCRMREKAGTSAAALVSFMRSEEQLRAFGFTHAQAYALSLSFGHYLDGLYQGYSTNLFIKALDSELRARRVKMNAEARKVAAIVRPAAQPSLPQPVGSKAPSVVRNKPSSYVGLLVLLDVEQEGKPKPRLTLAQQAKRRLLRVLDTAKVLYHYADPVAVVRSSFNDLHQAGVSFAKQPVVALKGFYNWMSEPKGYFITVGSVAALATAFAMAISPAGGDRHEPMGYTAATTKAAPVVQPVDIEPSPAATVVQAQAEPPVPQMVVRDLREEANQAYVAARMAQLKAADTAAPVIALDTARTAKPSAQPKADPSGEFNAQVAEVQSFLMKQGYAYERLLSDGVTGKASTQFNNAVKYYQYSNGLEVTGVVDRATLLTMHGAAKLQAA